MIDWLTRYGHILFIGIPAVCYLMEAALCGYRKDWAGVIVYGNYAGANVGLYMWATRGGG